MKNPHAVALGRMARGRPKRFSAAELERRRKRMRLLNARRRARAPLGERERRWRAGRRTTSTKPPGRSAVRRLEASRPAAWREVRRLARAV